MNSDTHASVVEKKCKPAGKRNLAPIAKAGGRGRISRVPKKPPWGRAKSTKPPKRRRKREFREMLDNEALAEMETGRFGGAFGPHPKEVKGCRALLGMKKEWEEGMAGKKMRAIRKECESDEKYANALIVLGDKILGAGRSPAIADAALKEIVKELFTLDAMDTRCMAAFLCRVQLNSSYILGETPIMQRLLEGEWGIRMRPAFIALAKRLVADLESANESERKWANECCITLQIAAKELEELVPAVECIMGTQEGAK